MSEADSSEPELEFDRHAAAFPVGAPDVSVGFINVHRATLTNIGDDGDADESGPRIGWHVYGVPHVTDKKPDSLVMFGDFNMQQGRWFVAVTTTAGLNFRDGHLPVDANDIDLVNGLSNVLGAWASNLLYDVAAIAGRALVSSNFLCDLEIPLLTPEAHFPSVTEDQGRLEEKVQAT